MAKNYKLLASVKYDGKDFDQGSIVTNAEIPDGSIESLLHMEMIEEVKPESDAKATKK
jgi:hypothetical protein